MYNRNHLVNRSRVLLQHKDYVIEISGFT